MLKKVSKDQVDIHLAILAWRNTPTERAPYSPAQKLYSRRTRTHLPTAAKLLQPEIVAGVAENIMQRQWNAKVQYDKHAKQLSELQTGQTVRIQPNGYRDQWKAARVIKKVGTRSYLVKTANGQVYRRNRKHLRCTTETINKVPQNYEDGEDEFAIPSMANQPTGEALSDRNEAASNAHETVQDEHPRLVEPSQTVTRAGRVVKPSSRYNDYVKL